MIIYALILLPIISGIVIYAMPKFYTKWLILLTETSLAIISVYVLVQVSMHGEIHAISGSDSNVLGISLIADKISAIFIVLTVFLFSICLFYAKLETYYNRKFTMLFLVLQGLLSGVFLTDDIFNIYVLLEVATVIVSILIMFKKDMSSVFDAIIYLFSQIICMVFYLFGIGYLYKIFGVLSISKIAELMPLADPIQLILPYTFIMTGICLKSALFPLASWLPRAHGTPSAPSVVSAILSGLYVKNGVYLLIEFNNMFEAAIDISFFFLIIGIITAVAGFSLALIQTDLKLILAFSTVSQMGVIVLGLSINHDVSNIGAIYHILSHSFFKSLLFLSAGMIIHSYKTRDIRQIHGVMKKMPVLGICTLIGCLAITGAPFLNASISKYFIQYGAKDTIIEYIINILNFGTTLAFVKYSSILWGESEEGEKQDTNKQAVLCILAVACFLGGIFGVNIINFMSDVQVELDMILYLEKSIIYIITVALASLIYYKVLKPNKEIYKLNRKALNFLQIVMAMVLFFITIAVVNYVSILSATV